MGRPKFYHDDVTVKLAPDGSSRLQESSDRRAIVQFVLDQGGVTTIGKINDNFKFDVSTTVKALVHCGWLTIVGTKGGSQ